jgi:hypothetical protein
VLFDLVLGSTALAPRSVLLGVFRDFSCPTSLAEMTIGPSVCRPEIEVRGARKERALWDWHGLFASRSEAKRYRRRPIGTSGPVRACWLWRPA